MRLNPQRMVKTGDKIADRRSGRSITVHYVVQKDGQQSFFGLRGEIAEVLGVAIEGEPLIKVAASNIVFADEKEKR